MHQKSIYETTLTKLFSLHTGEPPVHNATLKKTGVSHFMMIFRSRSGMVEEWDMAFTNWGLTMVKA